MRSAPGYLRGFSSQQTTFYRTKRRAFILPFLAAALVVVGCFRLASFADFSDPGNVSKFQLSFAFVALGYALSWHFARSMLWLTLIVAAVARIALLPVAPGDSFERKLWEAKALDARENPYLRAPDAPELERLRGPEWEAMGDKGEVSRSLPGALWAYQTAWNLGEPRNWLKPLLVSVDLLLCLLFALRFGADRAILYAWNPLAIYCVGGLGVDASMYLLPVVAGFLVWDTWIERKGGVAAISAAGGMSSALGQMVCVAAMLIGIGAAINLLALPLLLWIVWHVLKRIGIRAGLVALIFGAAPLVLTVLWASISLNVRLSQLVPPEFGYAERAISLIPSIVAFLAGGTPGAGGGWYVAILAMATIWMLHKCETLERFASFYLVWTLMLATAVFPSSFLILAIVGVASGNWVLRVVSLSAFAYFGAYQVIGDTGTWQVPWSLRVAIWAPFMLTAIQYAVRSRSREGFYVRTF